MDPNKHTKTPTDDQKPTGDAPASVDYAALVKELTEKDKAVTAQIDALYEETMKDIPQEMRSILSDEKPGSLAKLKAVMNTPKVKRLLEAAEAYNRENGPDSKRPSGKKPADLSGLTPAQMLAMGYAK